MRIRRKSAFFDYTPLRFVPLTPCPRYKRGGALGGMLCHVNPMDVPPGRIIWAALHEPQVIDDDVPQLHEPVHLPELPEQGFCLA